MLLIGWLTISVIQSGALPRSIHIVTSSVWNFCARSSDGEVSRNVGCFFRQWIVLLWRYENLNQPRSQGLSSSRPSGKMRDPGNEVEFKLFFSLFLRLWSNSVNRVLPRDSTPSFFRIFRNKTTFEFFFPVMASRVFFLKLRKKCSVASLLGNRV